MSTDPMSVTVGYADGGPIAAETLDEAFALKQDLLLQKTLDMLDLGTGLTSADTPPPFGRGSPATLMRTTWTALSIYLNTILRTVLPGPVTVALPATLDVTYADMDIAVTGTGTLTFDSVSTGNGYAWRCNVVNVSGADVLLATSGGGGIGGAGSPPTLKAGYGQNFVRVSNAGVPVFQAMGPTVSTLLYAITVNQAANVASGAAVAVSGRFLGPLTTTIDWMATKIQDGTTTAWVTGTSSLTPTTGVSATYGFNASGLGDGYWNIACRLDDNRSTIATGQLVGVGHAIYGQLPAGPFTAGQYVTVSGLVTDPMTYGAWGLYTAAGTALGGGIAAAMYQGSIAAGGSFNSNQLIQLPAKAGTYQLRVQNIYGGYGATMILPIPVVAATTDVLSWTPRSLAAALKTTAMACAGFWGNTQPPQIDVNITDGAGINITLTNVATINSDGTWTATIPAQSTLNTGTYYTTQFFRHDEPAVASIYYGIQG